MKSTDKTCVTLLVDKEEIGSVGATGMQSRFFENVVAEVVNLTGDYCELKVRRALTNSKMLFKKLKKNGTIKANTATIPKNFTHCANSSG